MAKIVVIGSSNVDFIMKMERLPARGETVTDATFLQTFGGKGANQAVGAARAGGDVWLVNCVGDDPSGPLVRQNLAELGVHTDYVFEERGVGSGAALIMIGGSGENMISVAPGANYRLTPQLVERCEPLISSAAIVLLQYEVLPETLSAAISLAYHHHKPVMLNLAPARPISDEDLGRLAYLTVNEVEAEFLCGFAVNSVERAESAAQELRKRGPGTVIITLGEQGAVAAAGEGCLRVPAFQVKAVDTTAAGDIFCGSLAVALVEGRPLRDALGFASAAAAISVTRMGAQPSAPSREEIERFLAEQ